MRPPAVSARRLSILALLAILVAPLDFEDPDARVIESGRFSASRADVSAYLKRIKAFDTKYDRIQPSFYHHFSLIRGIALRHPEAASARCPVC